MPCEEVAMARQTLTEVAREVLERSNGKAPKPLTKPKDVIEFARAQGVVIVDLKFVDLLGTWQHFSIPITALSEEVFQEGLGFDGSSIRGFQSIDESDMILIPDPTTAVVDPVCEVPTLSLICDVYDPVTREPYTRDPRYIARKAETYLKRSGIADVSYWGPEVEFFIFDNIRFDQGAHYGFYFIDSEEGIWNSGRDEGRPNLGHRPRWKEGYFPVPPADSLQDLRSEIVLRLMQAGIEVETHHHEVATGGQCEIDMRFKTLTRMADQVLMYKYIIKNVARAHGKTATFMPKPLFGDNGSGMHVHQSLWKEGRNLFWDERGYAGLSELARYYIGGILHHTPALLAFCAPTTNSYRRLVPGYEAPVNLVYSRRNRSAGIRIPMYSDSPAAKRIEYRCPDPSANPYLAFAAILMAGLDGIQNRIDPGDPVDVDLYELPPEEARKIKQVPGSLEEALRALERDHEFLLRGGVFTPDVIETWIELKRKEVDAIRLRPHPYEFYLYYSA
jgi:glutamine synthetase